MKLKENTPTIGQGLIVAIILENKPQSNNPNGFPKNENDLREQRQSENPSSNPDPELEDPNFVSEDDAKSEEDPLEFPEQEGDNLGQGEPQEELPIEEDDHLDREDPLELPEEEDVEEVGLEEDEEHQNNQGNF